MPKTIVTTLFHCIILTPIFMMSLFISPPLKSLEADKIERDPEVVAISNWQVFNSLFDQFLNNWCDQGTSHII